ncbi:MAG: tRNA 2-methylthio-N6-isopentenyl adenosine(37) hydroxylase MiaE [Bacteroidetes bacterium]|nr:MAG: tRNA 2-methylthio-N6-isopentenyl adenosine(37) hydroxylase MiaE [Bacteroidota bacterium]
MATDPRWADIAEKSIEFILTDHAWCEQKAATHGISIISRFSRYPDIVAVISPIVAEEWGHFRRVLKELNKRGFELGPQRKDEYVNKLNDFVKRGDHIEKQLVEYLLAFAMIEARSCERFRLLSLHIGDPELKKFYNEFMISEAGHYKAFLDLARKYSSEEHVTQRWQEWIEYEAEMVKTLEIRGDRMH